MASTLWSGLAKLTQNFHYMRVSSVMIDSSRSFYLQSCNYRAKHSTRERKLKELKKRKAMKAAALLRQGPYLPYKNKKDKDGKILQRRRITDEDRTESPDDVWFADQFKFRVYKFADAVNLLREVFHPSVYDKPDALVNAYIELDMSTDKKSKFYDNFVECVNVPHLYNHKEHRSILAFCKTREQMDAASEAGAALVGSSEVVRGVKRGKIMLPDFDFIIAHPNILAELTVIRGLLRKNFPSLENGRLSHDLGKMVTDLRVGTKYEAKKDEFEPDYGFIDVTLGPSTMTDTQLEENLQALIDNIKTKGPVRTKNMEGYRFITRCFITSPSHSEKFLINVNDYLGQEEEYDSDKEDDEPEAKRSG